MIIDVNELFLSLKSEGTNSRDIGMNLDKLALSSGEQNFSQQAATALVALTLPELAVPQSLHRYLPMICDGIHLLLSRTPYSRLKKIIVQQLALPKKTEPGERLLYLARQYPTLHKLGQIVARNRSLDAKVKLWLTALEVQLDPDDDEKSRELVGEFLNQAYQGASITISSEILAQASVAKVIRFSKKDRDGKLCLQGVVKILKQKIRSILEEELQILDDALIMFEKKRLQYKLGKMEISQLFQTVRKDLLREVDLQTEQLNLAEAEKVFIAKEKIRIPKLLEISNPDYTVMEFVDGKKITDTDLSSIKKRGIARLVFEALICQPLFCPENSALFHGDPHAGNIMAVKRRGSSLPDIALLDWTLAGHLTRSLRRDLIQLILRIQMQDSLGISGVVAKLSGKKNSTKSLIKVVDTIVKESRIRPEYTRDPLHLSFFLLQELTVAGIVFPAELVLFRKAYFTLEGVLRDIAPDFDPGSAMLDYIGKLLIDEIPQRYSDSIFSFSDNASNYNSLISNDELRCLLVHYQKALWNQFVNNTSLLLETQTKMTGDLVRYFYSCDRSH